MKQSINNIQTSNSSLNTSLPALTRQFTTHIPTFTSRCSPNYSNVAGATGYLPSPAENGIWPGSGAANYPNTDGSIGYVTMPVTSRNRNAAAQLSSFSAAASLSASKYLRDLKLHSFLLLFFFLVKNLRVYGNRICRFCAIPFCHPYALLFGKRYVCVYVYL